jgi:hypothetical protein
VSRPLIARGRTITVKLHRGRVTLSPTLWERLRHHARARHFHSWEAALEWTPPGLLRGGELLFDLSASGSWADDDEAYLVKYRRSDASEFARLVKAGNWLEVLVG